MPPPHRPVCGFRRRALPFSLAALSLAAPAFAQDSATNLPGNSPAAAARHARIQSRLAARPDAIPTLADELAGFPDFDIRVSPSGHPAPVLAAELEALYASNAWTLRNIAAAALARQVRSLAIDDDPLFATPRFIRSTEQFLTPPADPRADPADTIARFIAAHADLVQIDPREIPAARLSRNFLTQLNGARHLTFQQQVHSPAKPPLDLFGCEIRATLSRCGELVNISSTMIPRPAAGFALPPAKLSAADAIILAAASVGISLDQPPVQAESSAATGSSPTRWVPIPGLRAADPITTTPIAFPRSRTDVRPAFSVVIPAPGVGHTYDVIIDAATGELLHRTNRLVWDTTQPIRFRVFTGDSPSPYIPTRPFPDSFQPPIVAPELVTISPQSVAPFSRDGWIPDGGLETIGNNIAAHLDLNSDNLPDLPRPAATLIGDTRFFDFPIDLALPPSSYRAAAVAHLFYYGNLFHDIAYQLGFDEPAGNFQTSNFGRGGVGNDAILADAQDGDGLGNRVNNANFDTSGADGSTARVQMYLWDGPDPDRDGDLDAAIAFHEFTHGLSIRLHNGLVLAQSRALGEGWSDFFALSLLAAGADPNANYAFGPYSTYLRFSPAFNTNYYFGIRRFPYSTRLEINPTTFADIDANQISFPPSVPRNLEHENTAGESHNAGEIWCNALWECRAAMWQGSGATGGPAANLAMLRLVTDAMKLSPANPTFVQARDAIFQADLLNHDGAHRVPLWLAFSRRGLGVGAIAPNALATIGVIESFQNPFRADFSVIDGLPARLAPDQPTTIRLAITPVDLDIIPGTARLNISADFAPTTTIPFEISSPNEYSAQIPPQRCASYVRFWFSVQTSFGEKVDPPVGAYSIPVFTTAQSVVFDDFETDTGWTLGPGTATGGAWVRADPVGTAAQPEDDHSQAPGTTCWVTGNGPPGGSIGAADIDSGFTTLLSPAFNLAAYGDARISYWRWFSTGAGANPFSDVFRIDVSTDNGATWTNAETLGPDQSPDTMPGWRFSSWSLRSLGLAPTAAVRIRFIASDEGAGSIVEAALDDFSIEALLCTPVPTCPGDFNRDGALGIQDLFDYLRAYFNADPAADLDHSGDFTVQDIFDYLNLFFTPC